VLVTCTLLDCVAVKPRDLWAVESMAAVVWNVGIVEVVMVFGDGAVRVE
jgi:hypothetical protein